MTWTTILVWAFILAVSAIALLLLWFDHYDDPDRK
jgi:hypothetical protein